MSATIGDGISLGGWLGGVAGAVAVGGEGTEVSVAEAVAG